MGSTMFKGVSLQQILQLDQVTQTPQENYLQDYTILQQITIQDIQRIQRFQTLGPSMPQVALTPLGLPSLAI